MGGLGPLIPRSQLSRYNSQNFQNCLDRYKQLAALVNEELERDRIDWALKIRPWRNEQRKIIGRLIAPGGKASPYFTFLRKWLTEYTKATEDLFLDGDGQRIYLRLNPFEPYFRYVGRHEGPEYLRDDNALRLSAKSDDLPLSETLFNQRVSKRRGGPGMTIDMPLFMCPPGTERLDAHRLESWYQKQIGTMQGYHERRLRAGARSHYDNQKGRKKKIKPRRRPVARLMNGRTRDHDAWADNAQSRVTTYTTNSSDDRATADLTVILKLAMKSGEETRVTVNHGANEITNKTLARLRFSDTEIILIFADDMSIKTTIRTWLAMQRPHLQDDANRYERIKYIDILHVNYKKFAENSRTALDWAYRVGRKPHSAKSLAKTVTHSELVRIFRAAKKVKDKRLRKRAEGELIAISKKVFHVSLLCEPSISYPASIFFPKHLIRRAGTSCLKKLEGIAEEPRQRLIETLRTTRAKAATPGQVLVNHKKFCNDFDPAVKPECACNNFPKGWRQTRQFGEHFTILSDEYTGPGEKALHCSHKSPFEVTHGDAYGELCRSLHGMKSTLPMILQAQITDTMITATVQSIIGSHHELDKQHRTNSRFDREKCVCKDDVIQAKRFLHKNGACVAPVDKGAGRLAIMCPVVMWQAMRQAWPDEPERCEVLCPATASRKSADDTEQRLLREYVKYYHQKDWKRISKLYGVDSHGEPVQAALPRAYANPKLKTIIAALHGRAADNVIKGRPISPHTKHPLKNVYNRAATAHHFILTKISTQRVTRMFDTAEYKVRLHREAAALQRRHTARGGGQLCYLRKFGDLDGMYTNISVQRMNESLRANIQRVKDSSEDGRRFPMRNLDRIAVGKSRQDGIDQCHLGPAYNHETQVEIRFSDLTDICEYSNDNSIMRVGRQIRQYVMGTPMGEQGSCAKANGVCLDDELRIDMEREDKHQDSERNLSLAYVDDKHAIVAYDANDQFWTRASAQEYMDELMT